MSVEEYEDDYEGGGATRWVITAVVAIVLIGAAVFARRAMAGGGPATLAEAVQQARAGDLPCGDTSTAAPAGTPPADAGGFGGAGGTQFALRAICGQNNQTTNGAPGAGGGGRFGGGFGFGLTGQVTAVSGDSLTIQSPRGDQTVKIGPNTKVSKSSSASASDVKKGDTVIVGGAGGGFRQQQPQTDSTPATSVLIVPSSNGQ